MEAKKIGDVATEDWLKKIMQAAEEREAKEKAEWEALPEEEKQRIIAEREKDKTEQEREQAERDREELIGKWTRRGITPKFYDATWDNWIADTPEKQEVKEKIRQAWKKNLFVIGKNGTGKTHLAMCLVKEGAIFRQVAEMFRTVREDLSLEQETIDDLGTCGLLILDEAGRQKGTDFERNLMFEIIDKRWNYMLPTMIIGNINKKEFADLYGQATVDRLRPETVVLCWESMREKLNLEEEK